ncbi:MAG: hypothetical protein R3E10_11810 [Gemmatimonadota bacterium]
MGRGTDDHGFPVVRVAAYDAERHRLWAVCDRCRRWNLWPLEDRAEILEAIERLAHDRGVPVANTANITLLQADEVALVRVGDAGLAERSWWRYGRELQLRYQRQRSPRFHLTGYLQGTLTVLGQSVGLADENRKVRWDRGGLTDVQRWRRFGRTVWNGRLPCTNCGSIRRALLYDTGWFVHPVVSEAGLELRMPCPRCDFWSPGDAYSLTGPEAEATLRRILAYQHFNGADAPAIEQASQAIERVGSVRGLLGPTAGRSVSLWSMDRVQALALDIAINEASERRALRHLALAYEATWRREEELAEIIDTELTW